VPRELGVLKFPQIADQHDCVLQCGIVLLTQFIVHFVVDFKLQFC